MKKSKKRARPAARKKGRAKQKQAPRVKKRAVAPADAAPPESPFGSAFDFASPVIETGDLVSEGRSALQEGKPGKAFALCRRALDANPGDAQALNLAGIAAFQTGQGQQALDLLQTAAAFAPDDAEIRTNLGNVLAGLGDVKAAEEAYQDALKIDSDYTDATFNHGVLLDATGRQEEALASYQATLEAMPDHAGARLGLGNVLKAMKRLDAARIAYQAALRNNPDLAEARVNLAAVLQELGDFEGAAAECKKALERAPDMTEAHYNLGIALQELGDYSQANSHYDKVLDAEPSHAAAALNIAYGLQQMGQLDQAVDGLERTLEIDPDFAKAAVNLADLRLQQGKPEEALKVCDFYLAKHPSSPDLLAFRAMALCDLGETKAAEKLMDFDRLVKPVTIQAPSGYSDMEAFNAALVDHVVTHPTLTFAPQSHATREGRHSGELLAEPKGPIAGLEQAIWQAAEQYRAEQGQDTDHPFLSSPPEKLTLSVWGVVMQSAGHQIPHIHPAAWLSGVYYASVPDIVEHDRDDHAGWIAFGKPPDHFHNKSTQRVEFVKPAPSRMVLFPSYFYHHTVPFEAEGLRVSIAFDLMPA